MKAILKAEDITKDYGREKAVRGISADSFRWCLVAVLSAWFPERCCRNLI